MHPQQLSCGVEIERLEIDVERKSGGVGHFSAWHVAAARKRLP
jgi:hypothetical protein